MSLFFESVVTKGKEQKFCHLYKISKTIHVRLWVYPWDRKYEITYDDVVMHTGTDFEKVEKILNINWKDV